VKVAVVPAEISVATVKEFRPIAEEEVKLPSLAALSGRKDSLLPPLIRY
jgi:hypothetical protein